MALNTFPTNSYVKFVRTNSTLWTTLKLAGSVDADTLYFIIDDGSDKGSLYLGSTLIASGVKEGVSLESLVDVTLSADLGENDILVHNGERWVNQSIYDFAETTMVGASADQDGKGGLVPMPGKGQQDLYLKGDGTWASPTATLETTVGNLDKALKQAQTDISTIIGSDHDLTMRDVAQEEVATAVANLLDGAPKAFDTLKEIAEWIAGADGEVNVTAEELITDVANIKDLLNAETTGLVPRVEALETRVGSLASGLDDIVGIIGNENNGLIADIAANATAIAANAESIEENANAITILRQLLTWNVLAEESVQG